LSIIGSEPTAMCPSLQVSTYRRRYEVHRLRQRLTTQRGRQRRRHVPRPESSGRDLVELEHVEEARQVDDRPTICSTSHRGMLAHPAATGEVTVSDERDTFSAGRVRRVRVGAIALQELGRGIVDQPIDQFWCHETSVDQGGDALHGGEQNDADPLRGARSEPPSPSTSSSTTPAS